MLSNLHFNTPECQSENRISDVKIKKYCEELLWLGDKTEDHFCCIGGLKRNQRRDDQDFPHSWLGHLTKNPVVPLAELHASSVQMEVPEVQQSHLRVKACSLCVLT